MTPVTTLPPDLRTAVRAVLGAWRPFLVYEIAMSLVSAFALGPLALAVSSTVLRISGEGFLGNWELFRFLMSPLGLAAILLGGGLTLSIVFIEYSGLLILAIGVLTGRKISLTGLVTAVARAAWRLVAVALLQTALAMLAAAPFLLAAWLVYWLLLSGSDINYYLTERPLRFWIAAACGATLLAGLTAILAWFFVQWIFAVPLCLAAKASWWGALQSSTQLMRGRGGRLLAIVTAARLLEEVAFAIAWAVLDRSDHWLLSSTSEAAGWLVWSTVLVLLFDVLVIEVLSAIFAVTLAVVIAFQFLHAQKNVDDRDSMLDSWGARQSEWPAWRAVVALLILLAIGPALSIAYVATLARQTGDPRAVYVTAHRAGPKSAPENSLDALRLGLDAGADFVEVDVQRTADGHVVLLHDKDLRRVTGDPRSLRELDLAQVASIPLLLNGVATQARIPTLDQFLAACNDTVRINVELKADESMPGLGPAVLDVLRRHNFVERAVVSCFDLPPLKELSAAERNLPVGMILSAAKGDLTTLPVDFLSLNHRLVNARVVRRAHERGMQVHAWTVNDRQLALRLIDLGCDNLITSDPAVMREVVDWYTGLGEFERMFLRVRWWLRR